MDLSPNGHTPPIAKRERPSLTAATAISSSSSKPPFHVVPDDSKPVLRDPLLTSDPIKAEQILLQPPPLKR